MSKITVEKYEDIERNIRWVSGQLQPIVKPEIKEDLRTTEYLISVIRSHARTFSQPLKPEDRAECLESLYDALYR